MVELIAKNVEEDGKMYDRLYHVDKCRFFVNFARNTEEEQEVVLDNVREVITEIMQNLANEGIYI
jgi:sarcosine oxidase delta subunit